MMRLIEKKPVIFFILLLFASLLGAVGLRAQDADDKSSFIQYVEEQISSENFQIRLNGIDGTLSSDVSFASITIADTEGVWLTISKPRMIWTRTALLTGKLSIDSLTAESVDYVRQPLADEALPDAQAKPFELPQLPVSIVLDKLEIDTVNFGEPVFGLASQASVEGKIALADGALDLDLSIVRKDGPGGQLTAMAVYDAGDETLKLDIDLAEPEDGIIANALNLEGNPPVSLSIKGDAPIAELKVDLGFDVKDERILTGNLQLDGSDKGTLANARLSGPLSKILPERHRAFFGPSSDLQAQLLVEESGAIDVRDISLDSGNISLDAKARRLADGFLSALNVQLDLTPTGNTVINVPVDGNAISLERANMKIRYNGEQDDTWNASLDVKNLQQNDLLIPDTNIDANGTLSDFQKPTSRRTSFEVTGDMTGIKADDPNLAQALGSDIKLYSSGLWKTNTPTEISAFRVNADAFSLTSSGTIEELTYDGMTSLDAKNLASLSGLADRTLAGRAKLSVDGSFQLIGNVFDLIIKGVATDLKIDDQIVDTLLEGKTNLSGGISRSEDGTKFNAVRLSNNQMEASLDGRLANEEADISGKARIRNINLIADKSSGPVSLDFDLSGKQRPFDVNAKLLMEKGRLQTRQVENLALTFNGLMDGPILKGDLGGDGRLAGEAVSLSGNLNIDEETVSLKSLLANITDTKIQGDFLRDASGIITSNLTINSDDVGDVAAIALQDASGAINGVIELLDTDGLQTAKANITMGDFRYAENRINKGKLVATVFDAFNTPKIGATLNASGISASGVSVKTLEAKVGTQGAATDFEVQAALAQNNTKLNSTGSLTQDGTKNTIVIDSLNLSSNITDASLRSPATIVNDGNKTTISKASLKVGSGNVSVGGTIAKALDLLVDVNALPLSIANAIQPDAQAGGTISGSVRVSGATSNPIAAFNLNGSQVTARQLNDAGVSAINISASGEYEQNTVKLSSAAIKNNQGISIDASGNIPISGNGLDVRASGTAPLEFASAALAERGASVTGAANFDLAVRGSLSAPNANGNINIRDASYTDPLANLKLVGINLAATLSGDRVEINQGQARIASGGSVNVSGGIGISGDLPANIQIALNDAKYTDGQTFSTQASGRLTVTGNLLGSPLLGGQISLGKTEITIPESFANDSELLQVEHINPNAKTSQTLARRDEATPKSTGSRQGGTLRLDLKIDAPNQIFVRGRGLDAEMGGNIRLTGPINNVQPIGRFELRRGRISIIGQRIDLTQGQITLTGDLDPIINLTAQTKADDVDAFIKITGRISDVDISFSSQPELPQDEVLSLIIFGRGLNDLSPTQIARLAAIAAELTGSSSPGLVDGLREGAGLDDLDIVEDSDGNAAVKAGKYINDNVYLGVQAGQDSTEATINLDITDNITARGAVGSDGETSLGIFLEKDY